MIVSILTTVGMAIGVLIESLLGGPTVSTIASGSTIGDKRVELGNGLKKIESSIATTG